VHMCVRVCVRVCNLRKKVGGVNAYDQSGCCKSEYVRVCVCTRVSVCV